MTDTTPTPEEEVPSEPAPEESVPVVDPSAPAPGTTEEPETTSSSGSEDESTPAPSTTAADAAVDPDAGRVPREVISIDPTVEQGNRVTLTTPNLTSDPIGDLKTRIEDHFNNAGHIVNELRALADELANLLNQVKVGT